MVIDKQHLYYIGQIRHWNNVKMAIDEGVVWIKDITVEQVSSVELNSIPHKTIFENKKGLLFLPGNFVPERKMPGLLWTQLQKAIPLTLPVENYNYFGIRDKINIKLSLSDIERGPHCIMTQVDVLGRYMVTAPTIRLKNLSWVIINADQCLVMGSPVLPIPGDSFWLDRNFIIPSGYELRLFYDEINAVVNPENDCWIVWNKDSIWYTINKQLAKPLSLSSFRISFGLP